MFQLVRNACSGARGDLVRKSLKDNGGSHNFENRFFIDSISTVIAGHACFLSSSGIGFGKPRRAQGTQKKQQLSMLSTSSVV